MHPCDGGAASAAPYLDHRRRRADRADRARGGLIVMAEEDDVLEVKIDWDRCMGSGNCVFWAPETFDLSDDGHAVVVDAAATEEERLRIAAQGCPVGAISLWRAGAEVTLEENT
jgi:ferredoxin